MKNWNDDDAKRALRRETRPAKSPRMSLRPPEKLWESDWRTSREVEARESELAFERASGRMPVR